VSVRTWALVAVAALFGTSTVASPAVAEERVYRSEHFALTWTDDPSDPDAPGRADENGDGVPDTVTRMTDAFEDARAFLLEDLGHRAPPTRGRYNLYLSAAIDRGFVRTGPGGNGRSRPSFITIPKDLMRSSATEGEVRTFAVHEYFHAVQLGYDAGEDRWIFEATSSWAEGLFGPARDHNHVYLYDFVPRLELGLRSEDGIHEYGAFLFIQFLTERYGGSPEERHLLVRELWEAMAVPEAIEGAPDDDSFGALARVLAARGVTVQDAWREFQLWAWQIRRFEKGDEYRRALRDQRWPTAPAIRVADETCRLTADAPEGLLPALAGDYVRLVPATTEESQARVTVRGPAGATAFAIVRPERGSAEVRFVDFDSNGIGFLDVAFGRRGATRVVLGLGNGTSQPGMLEYSARLVDSASVVAHAPLLPSTTIYGTAVRVSGTVECGGAPAPFAHIAVTRTDVATGATEVTGLTTDAFGRWELLAAPPTTTSFSVRVEDPLLSTASSISSTIGVNVAVNMTIVDDEVAEGEAVVVEGNVAPVHDGRVVLERRRPNGHFETAAEVELNDEGRYRFDHVLPGPGVWEVRVTMPDTGDDDHLPGDAAPRVVQVGVT
jgi:hypothetical protein